MYSGAVGNISSEKEARAVLWTRLKCGGPSCRYLREYPGQPRAADLDACGLCGSPVQAVTVYRISETCRAVQRPEGLQRSPPAALGR
jgi:hypothetical protein